MSVSTFVFDMDNPDDVIKHMACIKATDMAIVLFDITYRMKLPEDIAKEIDNLMYKYNINLDEILQ